MSRHRLRACGAEVGEFVPTGVPLVFVDGATAVDDIDCDGEPDTGPVTIGARARARSRDK